MSYTRTITSYRYVEGTPDENGQVTWPLLRPVHAGKPTNLIPSWCAHLTPRQQESLNDTLTELGYGASACSVRPRHTCC